MSTRSISLPGRELPNSEANASENSLKQFLDIEVVTATTVDLQTRGTVAEKRVVADAEDHDVVEVIFDNGTRQWWSVEQLQEEVTKGSLRGATPKPQTDEIEIPSIWVKESTSRGVRELAGKLSASVVKLLRPKADQFKDLIASHGPELAAKAIAESLEKKIEGQLNPGGEGLYRFTGPQLLAGKLDAVDKLGASDLNNNAPYLLFLHGTASSSVGSFGRLGVRHDFDVIGIDTTPEWDDLQGQYPGRVVAYEHRTLSKSPVQNAIELASTLPGGSRLHLVSHSRGGLVGELLCLSQVKELGSTSQMKDFLDRLSLPFAKTNRTDDIKDLQKLVRLLADKKFRIERFVRVACPARGTKLLNKKINDFFSGIFNLMENLPWMKASPSLDFVRSTIVALLQYPTDPKKLPGIEAMMPESPLVAMLNTLNLTTKSDLAVIQGDIEPGGLLDKLKLLPIELLFREENDLIVNTRSMGGGLKREKSAYKFFDHGQEVSHFNYFTNHKTRTRLVNWLKSETGDLTSAQKAGFELLVPEAEIEVVSRGTRAAKPDTLPVVFVVPGIMGSHLSVNDDRIWLDPFSLALGGMNKLRIDAKSVVAEAVVASAYKDLVRYLKDTYEVIPFPYDWRRSLTVAADNLRESVERELERHKRPVRFVAHSMGGLVVRTMIARHAALWQELKTRDSRLLMLGTPNRGSFVVPQILAGKERLLNMLAMVDLKNNKQKLLEIIRHYDGLLEMLPDEYLEEKSWASLKGISLPESGALGSAKALRAKLADAVDKDRMFYVAGTSASTPFKLESAGNGVNFIGTTEGDGRVTYESGKLTGVKTWFANAEHGDLAAHRDSFSAFAELLEKGATDKLPTSPIVRRGVAAVQEHLILEEDVQMFPDEADLAAAALGGQIVAAEDVETHTLNISVVHTHLRNARFPIAVGHYKGDQIVGAEGVINRLLDNRLSQLSQLGMYPGDEGTAEIVCIKESEIEGAMVIGLGEFGDINRNKVRNGIVTASLRHALNLLNDDNKKKSGKIIDASFSALLLGTYSSSAFNPLDSVSAIVEGAIQTNRILQKQGLWNQVRVNSIELIELYEDIATQAVRAAYRLTERPPLDLSVSEKLTLDPPYLVCKEGGQPQRPLDLYSYGWSRKVRIAVDDKPTGDDPADAGGNNAAGNKEKRLSFSVFSERARIEEKMLPTQRKLVDGLVKQAIDSREYNNKLGTTLFELLIPNNFKDQISAEGDLMLYVDSESAQYPWELLAERTRDEITPVVIGKGHAGRGMIRQLATGDFRANPQSAQGGNVLVVGDPELTGETLFPPLPGARQEALIVNQAFGAARGGQFTTYPQIGRDALSIITALFERDYRILHLAGHGMYDANNPLQSGMILGNGMRLTAAEIQQLRVVPDLVFINCCYLGVIDVKPEANKLAASISMELIKMGVRAVVAAGWEVDDAAAKTFAEVFYQCMLENMRFGDAVKNARTRVYREHPLTNTWGAYQCYGDPDFMLDRPSDGKAADEKSKRYFSPREYRDELRRTSEQAKQADADYRKILRDRLEGIYDSIPNAWLDAEMLGILGDAWGSLGEYEESRKFYGSACQNENSNITLKQIQQHANLLTRQAQQLHDLNKQDGGQTARGKSKARQSDGTVAPQPKKLLDDSLALLKKLRELNETAELASMFGSHYKRRAQVLGNVEANLKEAAQYYNEANQKAALTAGHTDLYPTLNWLTLEALLITFAGSRTKKTKRMQEQLKEVRASLDRVLAIARELKSSDDLWKRVHLPDATLLHHLLEGDLGKEENINNLIKAYHKAIGDKANAKLLDAVTGQMDFLIEMLERGRGNHKAEINALVEIKNGLEQER